jgi:ABC-2 type transport system ATP-binding protein
MTTSDPAVRVRGLTKSYGTHRAVDGLDLDVERGETFALLGPNGAGKTTTVEILEGYRRADGGTVSVLGHDPATSAAALRSRIGIVLQTATDQAELTVAETIHHFARYYPRPRDPDEVIEAVGLQDKRRVRVRKLSGGQRRRLDVALGIIGTPELLFLDEPTTGFDPQARRQFWQLVRDLGESGTTILLTTHYLDEAEQLADRVAVIARGRLLDVDTPQRVGGRDRDLVQVTWTDAGGPHTERTARPTELVARLGAAAGGEVVDLQVRRPTLEDVYLDMVSPDRSTTTTPQATDLEVAR